MRELPRALQRTSLHWRVTGTSIRGLTHIREGLPNQDCLRWLPETGHGPCAIVCASDGHGNVKSFRSHQGADFAVRTATGLIDEFLIGQTTSESLSSMKRLAEERLPQALVRRWQEEVQAHLVQYPFTEAERKGVIDREGLSGWQLVGGNQQLAYGATLLCGTVTDTFGLFVQLGDGDIVVVDEDGTANRVFLFEDPIIGDETTSLCSSEAWKEVRVRFVPFAEEPPAMIILSTDGYSKSFRSEEDFIKVGRDYLEMIRSQGIERVGGRLNEILEETSRKGSGDDITLGLIKRDEKQDVTRRLDIVSFGLDQKADRGQLEAAIEGAEKLVRVEVERLENAIVRLSASFNEGRKSLEERLQALESVHSALGLRQKQSEKQLAVLRKVASALILIVLAYAILVWALFDARNSSSTTMSGKRPASVENLSMPAGDCTTNKAGPEGVWPRGVSRC